MGKYIYLIAIVLVLPGCGIYSFTGTNIDYNKVSTVTITNFYNEAGNGPPTMSQEFTEELRDYFQNNTSLEVVPEGGDLLIEGVIRGYRLMPVAPTSSGSDDTPDLAALQRLTISISASYINKTDDEFDFDNRTFSFYEDFDPQANPFPTIEQDLIDIIFEQIVLDIFSATVANW